MRRLLSILPLLSAYFTNAQTTKTSECILKDRELIRVEVEQDSKTGVRTTMLDNKRVLFDTLIHATGYAAGKPWFEKGERIIVKGRPYKKTGLTAAPEQGTIERWGEVSGVGIYFSYDDDQRKSAYVPVKQGCVFQVYKLDCGELTVNLGAVDSTFHMERTAKRFEKGEYEGIHAMFKLESKGIKDVRYHFESSLGESLHRSGTDTYIVFITDADLNGDLKITATATGKNNCPVYAEKIIPVADLKKKAKESTGKKKKK